MLSRPLASKASTLLLSYSQIFWCDKAELNSRPEPYQDSALNQLSYCRIYFFGGAGGNCIPINRVQTDYVPITLRPHIFYLAGSERI